jgi:hypothetical protein
MNDKSESLMKTEAPTLTWPLPQAHYASFARHGPLNIGWDKDGFHIYQVGVVRTKTLSRFPLTPEGWQGCWSLMTRQYPELAAAVGQRRAEAIAVTKEREHAAEARTALRNAGVLVLLPGCFLLGGHGFDAGLAPGARLDLYFTSEGLWATHPGHATPLIESPYAEATALDFSGPGRVTKGGGFIGGGFGLTGAAEGMLVASALNSLTTKSEIRSIIRWEAESLEAFFFTSEATPGDLRIKFSPVLSKIRPVTETEPEPDRISQLERLASLYERRVITDEEFVLLKKDILDGSSS